VIEAQRRIHELEAQREQEHVEPSRHEEPRAEEQAPRVEAPAFLVQHEQHEEAAPRREEPRSEPRVDPKELLDSAGLVMIETDRSKAGPVVPQAEEPVQLGRPRRERAKPSEDEPLQQVETKH
jgi:hypothetical protein